eukprot:1394154-Rhodomonas_salina.2
MDCEPGGRGVGGGRDRDARCSAHAGCAGCGWPLRCARRSAASSRFMRSMRASISADASSCVQASRCESISMSLSSSIAQAKSACRQPSACISGTKRRAVPEAQRMTARRESAAMKLKAMV